MLLCGSADEKRAHSQHQTALTRDQRRWVEMASLKPSVRFVASARYQRGFDGVCLAQPGRFFLKALFQCCVIDDHGSKHISGQKIQY